MFRHAGEAIPATTGTPAGVGGHVAAHSEATAAGLISARNERTIWHKVLLGRYAAIAGLGVLALFPEVGDYHYWVALSLLVIGLPYNALYDYLLRRTGVLQPTLAFSDPLAVVIFVNFVPEAFLPCALILLALTANNVVAFGRRLGTQSAIVSYLGVALVVLLKEPTGAIAALLALGVLGMFLIYVVGVISEDEHELRSRYVELLGNIDAVVWERRREDPGTLFTSVQIERLLGYDHHRWQHDRMWELVVHPADRAATVDEYRQMTLSGGSRELTYRMVAADGRTLWIQDRVRVDLDSGGRWTRMNGVMVDVTAMKQAEHKVNQMVNLVNSIKLALLVLDLDDDTDADPELRIAAMNPAAALLAGVRESDVIGLTLKSNLVMAGLDLDLDQLADVIGTGIGFTIDEHRPTGGSCDGRVYSVFTFPLTGRTVAVAFQDVTDRINAAEVVRRQALHDGLTGLPNRVMLNERVRNAIKLSRRVETPIALLVMDLDQFKEVNDALGHDQGDKLLIEVSRRLQRVVPEADTIARLGGDEFAVLLTADTDEEAAIAVAERVRAALDEPFHLNGITLQTNASIGIAVAPDHGLDAETLIQRADIAMYLAKRLGAGSALYDPTQDQSSVRRLALLGELRNAISEDELVLHYQPCLDLSTGEIRSAEALVRWNHTEHGMLPPAEFIELAEVSGMIRPLTRWVIEHALAQIRVWADEGIDITIGVNLSVKDLYDRDLVPWLADRLRTFGVDARHLKLELTESQLMDDPLLALEVLGKLKGLGAATSIDDFGTGYSSLAYLKHLPIDELKIDKSFIGNLVTDVMDLTIVRSTIDLSHNLGLTVVAEGVEDGLTLSRLRSLGCDRVQGFYVSTALPATEMSNWLSTWPIRARALEGVLDLNPDDALDTPTPLRINGT